MFLQKILVGLTPTTMPPPVSPLIASASKGSSGSRKIFASSRIMKFRGKLFKQPAVTVEAPSSKARSVRADTVHRESGFVFWGQRQTFEHNVYHSKYDLQYMPFWDRACQVLILLTRNVARVPQEAAFRLLAMHLKIMMMTSLTTTASLRLPVTATTMNLENLMREAKEAAAKDDEEKKPTGDEKKDGEKS